MYQIWACYADRPDELIESFEHEYQADYVCNELNLASTDVDDPADYRVCKGE